MKKSIIALSIVALVLGIATPALAKSDKGEKNGRENGNGLKLGQMVSGFMDFRGNGNLPANQFALAGTVGSTTTASIVVNVNNSTHVPNVANGLATVNVDANTKYSAHKDNSITLADIKAGQQIWVMGNVSGSTLTATRVHILDKITDQFSLTGVVSTTTSGSLVITVEHSRNLPALTNSLATVNVNADTKYRADKNETVTLADVKAGQKVMVTGSVSGTTLTAKNVHIKLPKGKVYGEVTAKTATSVTVKNTVTGVTQTINIDADTKVSINGEAKAVADVQVGDKGFVKFKTKISGMFAKVINLFR